MEGTCLGCSASCTSSSSSSFFEKQSSLLVWWKSLNWSNSESKGPADPECWDRLINSWKYVAMWCHTLSAQPISRFLLMCAFKFDNCIDCRAWEGFWETAVTSPDWMKAFDAPESPREISPRFSDCALAVMGFMAANYPARIESKCKCRQQRSSPVYQGTSRAWHWRCWMVRQIEGPSQQSYWADVRLWEK